MDFTCDGCGADRPTVSVSYGNPMIQRVFCGTCEDAVRKGEYGMALTRALIHRLPAEHDDADMIVAREGALKVLAETRGAHLAGTQLQPIEG